MLAAIHALTVIATLLICPIRCMGALPTSAGAAEQPRCHCCQHVRQDESSSDQNLPAHSGGCGCTSCLCHGAVRGDDSAGLQQDLILAFAFAPIVEIEKSLSPSCVDVPRIEDSSPPCVQGMALRILYQSFLC